MCSHREKARTLYSEGPVEPPHCPHPACMDAGSELCRPQVAQRGGAGRWGPSQEWAEPPVCPQPLPTGRSPAVGSSLLPAPSPPSWGQQTRQEPGTCGLCESMTHFPPVYEPLEPRRPPAARWCVEIHTAAGKGGRRPGPRAGHRRVGVGGGRLPQTTGLRIMPAGRPPPRLQVRKPSSEGSGFPRVTQ